MGWSLGRYPGCGDLKKPHTDAGRGTLTRQGGTGQPEQGRGGQGPREAGV